MKASRAENADIYAGGCLMQSVKGFVFEGRTDEKWHTFTAGLRMSRRKVRPGRSKRNGEISRCLILLLSTDGKRFPGLRRCSRVEGAPSFFSTFNAPQCLIHERGWGFESLQRTPHLEDFTMSSTPQDMPSFESLTTCAQASQCLVHINYTTSS